MGISATFEGCSEIADLMQELEADYGRADFERAIDLLLTVEANDF